MKELITIYNEDIAKHTDHTEEESFYMQLNHDEREEYLDMQITHLKSRIRNLNDEIFMNDFQRERNHPDKELYRTHLKSSVELLEENLVDLYKKQKSLDTEREFQKSLNTESEVA